MRATAVQSLNGGKSEFREIRLKQGYEIHVKLKEHL
jgi:hypothetical protein